MSATSSPARARRNASGRGASTIASFGIHEVPPGQPNTSIRGHLAPREDRRAFGKSLREQAPRKSHGAWEPDPARPDIVDQIKLSNRGRVKELIPVRMGRMSVSAFTFLRGAAGPMALDLAGSPETGQHGWICGDCHVANFGFFGSSERELAFDINDFDETIPGPWEWDLKRLAASIHIGGRDNGFTEEQCSDAVMTLVRIYRESIDHAAERTLIDNHHARVDPHDLKGAKDLIHKRTHKIIDRAVAKAITRGNEQVRRKMGSLGVDGRWRFRDEPPVLTRIHGAEAEEITAGLEKYLNSLVDEYHVLIGSYGVQDVALRVVGVGSVGTRPYLVMLLGDGEDDPLFLQVKEAPGSQLQPHLPPHPVRHEGERVVFGKRVLQARSGPFVGWTTIRRRHYYVRQLRDMKGSIAMEELDARGLSDYSLLLAGVLSAAHARAFDAAIIAGYCGKSDSLDKAIAKWAKKYADQSERDWEAMNAAIDAGKLPCERGV